MTPERITLAGLVLSFIGKAIADWRRERVRTAEREAKAEAARVAARDQTQRENESWLRAKVDEMVEHERAAYAQTLAALNDRITTLEEWAEMVPPLVEQLAIAVARIDPATTPTPSQMDALRSLFKQLRVDESKADHVLFTKAGT